MGRRPQFIDTPDDLPKAFFSARGRRAEKALVDMETVFSPLEMLDFAEKVRASDHPMRALVLDRPSIADLGKQREIPRFKRQSISEEVMFFSDGGKPVGKALLVCFGGLGGRLGIATCNFLQLIDAKRFDVLILRDPDRARFRYGVGDFATDFLSLVRAIDARFQPGRYRRVVSWGNSMGSAAAAQYAVLAGAERAIAIGTRPQTDGISLILREDVPGAFDPICDCLKHRPLQALWVYAQHDAEDRLGAEQLYACGGGRRLVIPYTVAHNIVGAYWQSGDLGWLFKALLDGPLPRPRDGQHPVMVLRRPLPRRIWRLLRKWRLRLTSRAPST